MSSTEIVIFDKEGNARWCKDIDNAWRGAMMVWKLLEDKYLPTFRPSYVPKFVPDDEIEEFVGYKPSRTAPLLNEEENLANMRQIWDLFVNEQVSREDKIVLGTTFDRVLVKREDFQCLIDAFESFEGTTSLSEQSEVIRELLYRADVIAVGWNQNSITQNQWLYDTESGDGEWIPYNCIENTRHSWLFEGLPA